jgi:outer membrane lipoprotein-sorting protein
MYFRNRSIYRLLIINILTLLFISTTYAKKSAMDWISAVDENMVLRSAQYTATMTVHLSNGTERLFRMKGKVVGDKYALMEYIEPKRDKGTKYLKREESLWIYFPRVDRTMQIQGHMLREGVQGGDMSFEDMSESRAWEDIYDAEIIFEDDKEVQIRLASKDMSVSYPYREISVNKSNGLPMRILNKDASDEPIKEILIVDYITIANRSFPHIYEIHSKLVEGKWTKFEFEEIEFNVDFDEDTFTKRSLEE